MGTGEPESRSKGECGPVDRQSTPEGEQESQRCRSLFLYVILRKSVYLPSLLNLLILDI